MKERRARLDPAEFNLGGRRRTKGLRRAEVAELVGVSERWYSIFESGVSDRRFSAEFIERVAQALRLETGERLALFRMALPPVDAIASSIEGSLNDVALQRLTTVREFARKLRDQEGFERAVAVAADALQGLNGANALAVVSLGRPGGTATGCVFGPRSEYFEPDGHRVLVAAHSSLSARDIAVCEEGPSVDEAADRNQVSISFKRIRPPGAGYTFAMAADEYVRLNGNLGARSAIATPVYRHGVYRGVLEVFWPEPKRTWAFEVEAMQTVLAILDLAL